MRRTRSQTAAANARRSATTAPLLRAVGRLSRHDLGLLLGGEQIAAHRVEAAVDVDQLARDPAGPVGEQPEHAPGHVGRVADVPAERRDRKSTRLNSSHVAISYA